MTWKRFFQRRARREESAVELEAYLQKQTEDNMERGMSADEARRAARIKLGNVTNILSEMAERDSFGWLEALWHDVRYGLRMLTKHRVFALVSLLTLALGIGANTAIFTVVDATLIRPLPFPNANRVVMIWERRMPDGERQNVTSPATFLNWQHENAVFDQMAAMFMTLVIRTDGDPRALIPALRQTVVRIDKNQPIADVVPMETLLSMSVARTRFATQVMAAFAFIAFLLAIVGIYGVISYDVEQRTREIGIRMALGAQRGSVIRLVLNRGMVLVGMGIAFGTVASLALTRLLSSILYETRPNDPTVFVSAGATLATVALCVAWFAVRRISSIEPMAVLRRE